MQLVLAVFKALKTKVQQVALEAAEHEVEKGAKGRWSTLSQQQQKAMAALAIFTNPAAKYSRDGRCWDACMALRTSR